MKAGMNNYRHLFGPVPSRRLGRSLGVDLTPFKTCTLDCIFCQLGRITHKTFRRAEYTPVWHVEAELDAWIKECGQADHITLSGSGEPTLHARFGDILQFIRTRTAIPTVLLSNGTLFFLPEVREAARCADIVKLSLSAWDQRSFEQVNRPQPSLQFACVVEGQRAFREGFHGKLWIEVFLLDGINTVQRDIKAIAALVESIAPDEIHLNTAVRPPAEASALAVPREQMEALAALFHRPAKVIAEFAAGDSAEIEASERTILAMLQRRPCTTAQIAEVFGMHVNEVSKYVGKLLGMGQIHADRTRDGVYYAAAASQMLLRPPIGSKRKES